MILQLNRTLQLWRYVVSYRQLLVLGVKSDSINTRRIIAFSGVNEIYMPSVLICSTLSWDEANTEEFNRYTFETSDQTYHVTARTIETTEDKLSYDAPVPFFVS